MRLDQGGGNGVSGALYTTSMELSNQPPLLPQTRSDDALLVAALQGTPVPTLAATDVAVALGDAPGSSSAAAEVYAFGPSQPGIYLIAVRWPPAATTPAGRPRPPLQALLSRAAGVGDLPRELHRPGRRQLAQPRCCCAPDVPRRRTISLVVCSCHRLAPVPAC
jgi:hypothetical protein